MTRRFPHARQVAHDAGATSAEYAILVAMIAGVIVSTVLVFGQRTSLLFSAIEQVWP